MLNARANETTVATRFATLGVSAMLCTNHLSIFSVSERFNNKLLENLESLVGLAVGAPEVQEVPVGRLTPGMVFMDDLYTQVGTLLVPKGFEVTETFLERARNFGPGILQEKVRVLAAPKSNR
jgi:hypothetical protein